MSGACNDYYNCKTKKFDDVSYKKYIQTSVNSCHSDCTKTLGYSCPSSISHPEELAACKACSHECMKIHTCYQCGTDNDQNYIIKNCINCNQFNFDLFWDKHKVVIIIVSVVIITLLLILLMFLI